MTFGPHAPALRVGRCPPRGRAPAFGRPCGLRMGPHAPALRVGRGPGDREVALRLRGRAPAFGRPGGLRMAPHAPAQRSGAGG